MIDSYYFFLGTEKTASLVSDGAPEMGFLKWQPRKASKSQWERMEVCGDSPSQLFPFRKSFIIL